MRGMMGEIAVVYLYGTSSPRETEQGKKVFIVEMMDLLSQ